VIGVDRSRTLVLTALLYPIAMMMVTAGLLAFVLLLFGVEFPQVSFTVLWFLSFGITALFVISRKILKSLGYEKIFVMIVAISWVLSILQSVVLLLFSPTA